jgi:hypothetical protein
MVANPREVLDTSTADQNDGVFLQIVSDSRDIGCNLDPIGETNTRNFAQSRVGLFGRRCVHPGANPPALRTSLQSRTLRFITNLLSARSNQLIEGRQTALSLPEFMVEQPVPGGTAPNIRSSSEKPLKCSKAELACQGNRVDKFELPWIWLPGDPNTGQK